jgi:PAS domain S-box-containing protein
MTGPWFGPEDAPALHDFWEAYLAHHDAVQEATLQAALEDPQFGPLVRAMPEEQRRRQGAEGLERMRRAIEGGWEEYEATLRHQGASYAALGVGYASWLRIVRAYTRGLVPAIVARHQHEPERLSRALLCMYEVLDRSLAAITQAYLDAKEASLLESEQRLAVTLDSIGDAVIATDERGRVTRLNRVAEQLTGSRLPECRGRPLDEIFRIVNEDTGARIESPVARVLREGVVVGLANHTALIARDGTLRPIADTAAPIRGASGETLGVVLVFRDMTEERRVEEAQRATAERHAAVLAAAPDAILTCDAAGRLLDANPAAERMFALAPSRLAALHLSDLVPALSTAADTAAISGEVEGVRSGGQRFPARLAGIPTRAREPIHAVFVTDLTATRELEQERARSLELELQNRRFSEASRLKSEFLANMSHELRTPLNSIIGFAELLHDGEVGEVPPRQKEFLGYVLTSGRHLLKLINDVLDLAKVEAGRMDFHPEPLRLDGLVGEVLAILRTLAARKHIRIAEDLDPRVQEVVLDPARLKQVLYNYVSNALKFTPEGGAVVVRVVGLEGSRFRLDVEDTGPGIREEDLPRLFQEFHQLDAGASKKHDGTGLGLALTRRLVEAQGGTVGVKSTPGRGSTFSATLPLRMETAPAPAPPQPSRGGGPRILVVDDDPADQAVIVGTLERAGYSVETAATGAAALEACARTRFDAVTLDLLLPDMNGLDVLRQLRASAAPDLAVVVITVVTENAAAGFPVEGVLPKPLEPEALVSALRQAGVAPRGAKILVIDDDAGSRRLISATLEQLGHATETHPDAARALEAAAARRPDAVVLDLLMPGVDGFAFLDLFRREPAHRSIPVLVWTVKDLTPDEDRRLREAAQAVLRKGAGVSELVNALEAWLPGAPGRAAG